MENYRLDPFYSLHGFLKYNQRIPHNIEMVAVVPYDHQRVNKNSKELCSFFIVYRPKISCIQKITLSKHFCLNSLIIGGKFVKLYPVNTTSCKGVCAALQKYFDNYSRLRRLIADRITCFTSIEFESFVTERNVQHIKNAVASPQAIMDKSKESTVS